MFQARSVFLKDMIFICSKLKHRSKQYPIFLILCGRMEPKFCVLLTSSCRARSYHRDRKSFTSLGSHLWSSGVYLSTSALNSSLFQWSWAQTEFCPNFLFITIFDKVLLTSLNLCSVIFALKYTFNFIIYYQTTVPMFCQVQS